MGNRRIYLGRESSKYAKIAGGAIVTVTSLFFVLMVMGLEISGSDDVCLGTFEDPCVSYGKICNLGPNNYDIYNPDEVKMDFSPSIPDSWMFFKDGRVKKNYFKDTGINFDSAGWRYENFTNATKPRKDRIYVHRFARYSCQDYMLVGLKNNPDDMIKWGVGIGAEYLDPFWYGLNESDPTIEVSDNVSIEIGKQIKIKTSILNATELLTAPWNTFDLSSEFSTPSGITQNGTYIWVVDYQDGFIYKYNIYGEYTGESINISDTADEPIGITQNGTHFWVSDSDFFVYKYFMNGTYTGDSFNTTVSIGDFFPFGLDQNGTNFWITGFGSGTIVMTDMDGVYVSNVTISIPNNYTSGITQNGTHFWVTSLTGGNVYEYLLDGTFIDSFDATTLGGFAPFGIDNDNEFLYITDWVESEVYKYYLNGSEAPEHDTICVDIDHPEYGDAFACGGPTLSFDLNISYFRKAEFNDSSTYKTFNTSNLTAYITAHQYDQLKNLSINVTGIGQADDIKIYVNGTLVKTILGINNEVNYNSTSTEESTLTLIESNSTTFKIPKSAIVISTRMNFTGNNLSWDSGITYIPNNAYGVLGGAGHWRQGFVGVAPASPSSTPTHAFDADLFSWTYPEVDVDTATSYIYENYSIPGGVYLANWTARYMVQQAVFPFVQDCWNGTAWDNQINDSTNLNPDKFDHDTYTDASVSLPEYCWNQTELQIRTILEEGVIDGFLHQRAFYYEGYVNYFVNGYPQNLTIEVGTADGVYEYEGFGEFSGSNSTTDFVDEVNEFLGICIADSDGNCDVPIYFSSDFGGSITIDDFNVYLNYTLNPVVLDKTVVENFIGNSTGVVDIPIRINISSGSINVTDLRYDYSGGNDTINILTYEQANTSNNESLNVFVFASTFFKNLPYTWASKIFFMPRTNSSKNVTAYGQTTITPVYNITTTNYGGDMNMSIKLNESFDCLNITWSGNSTKSTNKLNTSWQTMFSGLEYLNNSKIWLWADFDNCNATDQRVMQPYIEIESYCLNCLWY